MRLRVYLLTSLLVASAACSNTTTSPISPSNSEDSSSVSIQNNVPVISGTVYVGSATADHPLADANIIVVSGDETRTTRTSATGRYSISVPEGEGTITASKSGYSPKSWDITVANDVVVNFSLLFQ
jgi:hypothetical protein